MQLRCVCGRAIEVPPLTELQRAQVAGAVCQAAEPREPPPADELAAAADDEMPREFFMILAPDHVIAQRVHQEAFVHFIAAFDRAVKAFARTTEAQPGVDVQIGYALFPHGKRLIDLQIRPDILPSHIVSELQLELEALRQPPVEGGPVSFCCRVMLWGGAAGSHPPFQFPFSPQFGSRSASFDQLLSEAAGVPFPPSGSPRPRNGVRPSWGAALRAWIRRVKTWLTGDSARANAVPVRQPPPPAVAAPEFAPLLPTPADPSSGYTVAELTALIGRYPQHAPLYAMRAEVLEQQAEYDRAIADYTTFLALHPDQAEIHARRAMTYCAAGSQALGLKDLNAALQLEPAHVAALAGRGMIYLQLDAWDRALADFEAAIKHDRRNPSLQVHRGRTLIGCGDYRRAVEALSQALHLDPHHDAAYAWRALARRRASPEPTDEVIQSMLADFNAALEIQPEHAGYRLYRAEVRLGAGDIRGAAADCDLILACEPESGAAHALRGIARQRLGDAAGAIADCDSALEHGAESADIYLARAFAHEDLGETEAALGDCDAALEVDSQEVAAINLRGAIRLKLGHVDEAAEDFESAIAMEPHWALPYANRGNACRARGDNTGAILAYSRAIELEPQLVFAYLNRALAWADEGQDEKALQDFAAVFQIDPDVVGAYVQRAGLHLRRKEYDAAMADLNQAIRLQPELAGTYFQRGRLHLQQGNYDEALQDFDRAIELSPDSAAAYSSRGGAWIQKGEHDKADADFQQAIACEPGMAETIALERLLFEAAYYGRQEKFDEAISHASEALELDEACLPAYAIRAAAYWYSEQLVEAVDDFTQLIERAHGQDFQGHAGRGQVYAELGEFDLALADLNRAIRLVPKLAGDKEPSPSGVAQVYSGRGLALAGLGRLEEAMQDFDRAIQDSPDSAWGYYTRGLVFHHLGRDAEAATSFQQALEKDSPSLPPLKRSRAVAFLKRHGYA